MSREIALRTINFERPERLAFAKGEKSDFVQIGYSLPLDFDPVKAGTDEWGCVWKSFNLEKSDQGQVIKHP